MSKEEAPSSAKMELSTTRQAGKAQSNLPERDATRRTIGPSVRPSGYYFHQYTHSMTDAVERNKEQ